MAVDLSVPRPHAVTRAATIPARLLLGGIVAASFLVRYVAALGHTTPLYSVDGKGEGASKQGATSTAQRVPKLA